MKCMRCTHQEAEIAGECRVCHYVTMCLVVVHSHWPHKRRYEADSETELQFIHSKLREHSLKDFISESKINGAFLSLKLGNIISRLAYPAKVDGDELRRRVCDGIAKYIGEIDGVREYERKSGRTGSYMRDWTDTVRSWIGKAAL